MIRVSKSVIGPKEKKAVEEVLHRAFLGMGEETQKFENELQAYVGSKFPPVCVNSGTAALHLAIQTLDIKAGDEVLVPSLTFVATFQAISATGATPVACDVSDKNGLIDLKDAERKITKKTKAIIPVHYASYLGDLEALYAFAKINSLRVIEDAAHAFGGSYLGKKVGSFGDTICFSFDGIKNITCGEGGAVFSSDPQVLERIKDARLLGVMKDSEKRYKNERSLEFDVVEQGWRYHMSDIMAAIGRVQLSRLDAEFAPARQKFAAAYRERLREIKEIAFLETDLQTVVPHIMPIRVLNNKRDALRKWLNQEGVQTGMHYKPNHLLSKYAQPGEVFPVSEKLYEELLTIPLHPEVTMEDFERITVLIARGLAL